VGDELYVIEAGTLAVMLEIGGRAQEGGRLGPHDFFGEIALLGSGRRSATVRAETPAKLWSLSATDFQALLEREPDLASALERAAHAMKGSVGTFSARAAMEAARELEERGRSGDLAGAEAALVKLEEEIERLMPALRAMGSEDSS